VTRGGDPRAVYETRLAAHRATAEARARVQSRLSNARLAVFFGTVALAFFVFAPPRLPLATLAPPALAFLVLVVWHDRVIRARRRAERGAAWFEAGLGRLGGRFAELAAGERFRDPEHLYAEDLDLFGAGSLFALVCRARTPSGEETLARWLLAPAEPAEIRSRQAAVAELRDLLDLRERLALVGEEVAPRLHAHELVAWGAAAGPAPRTRERAAALGLSLLSGATLAAWIFAGAGPLPWLAALLAQGVFAWGRRGRVRDCLAGVERVGRDLDLLAELLACLEAQRFTSERLAALRSRVDTAHRPPSWQIARLRWLRDLADARRNQLFAPLGAIFAFTTQVALALEAWRARCGPALAAWIDAVAELEALASLAGQAFEHPADPFPEIAGSGVRFEAEGLGHPLLLEERCVRNDVTLSDDLRLYVVSGSNMSGKSTFLRSVGVNAVLALAGATVRARRLRISPLAVGASIRLHDSLLEGTSRFYAEITRLKQIVSATLGGLPVLFLLDEILHGTNSHDRRIGAEAVVRGLAERGAVGLVTTHDLALARIAEELAPRAANVHFEDHLEEGRVRFDYRLRPGVVTKSNALDLMRAVGIEV
jgi:hypothetical protein